MSGLTRPMLAARYEDGKIMFPVLATPKIDGIRALKIDGHLVSRSLKPIPNNAIRKHLEALLPDGADGEITCGTGLYETTSCVMSEADNYDPNTFKFYWFDWVTTSLDMPYAERIQMIEEYVKNNPQLQNYNVVPLIPDMIPNADILKYYESCAVAQGCEGIILRKPDGEYKCGRSTLSEGLLIKLKQYLDSEAIIIKTEELMHNYNEPKLDKLGKIVRSSKQDKLVGGNTLGAIVAKTKDNITFKIGTGYTDQQRSTLWKSRKNLIGKLVKYKHAGTGSKEAPREPVFLGIRHEDDTDIDQEFDPAWHLSSQSLSKRGKGKSKGSNVIIYTIGFTNKSAEQFFSKLSKAGVIRIIDTRINNTSQLAGFTKTEDLKYFAKQICGIDYIHMLNLAPTSEMYLAYKKTKDWNNYKTRFVELIKNRKVENLDREYFDRCCLLCSEHTPDKCHRKIITDYLSEKWSDINIIHLI